MMYGHTYAAAPYGSLIGRLGLVVIGAVPSIAKGLKRVMGIIGTKV